MVDEVTATCQVKRGRLVLRNQRQFDRQLRGFDERWILELSLRRLRATRSQQQNAYWWGVCLALASEHTGYSPEEMHEIAKQLFLPKRLAVADGHGEIVGEFVMGGTTRTLKTAEFSEFTERFKRWCAETLDLYIPDPNEAPLGDDR